MLSSMTTARSGVDRDIARPTLGVSLVPTRAGAARRGRWRKTIFSGHLASSMACRRMTFLRDRRHLPPASSHAGTSASRRPAMLRMLELRKPRGGQRRNIAVARQMASSDREYARPDSNRKLWDTSLTSSLGFGGLRDRPISARHVAMKHSSNHASGCRSAPDRSRPQLGRPTPALSGTVPRPMSWTIRRSWAEAKPGRRSKRARERNCRARPYGKGLNGTGA